MLLEKKDVYDMLRCPKTGSTLTRVNNRLIADSTEEQVEYEINQNYPILIDFDESVKNNENDDTLFSGTERPSYGVLLSVMKRLVSPPKKVTAENVKNVINLLIESSDCAKVLIIGGGSIGQGMEPFYNNPHIELVAFDIYASQNVQFLADAHNIPLPDNSFDAVVIQAVLEHVLEPSTVVLEIHRVLKQAGIVYAETPFLQNVHEGAYDFTRFTESGHRYLFKNFELIKSGVSAGAGSQLLWSLDNFFRGLFRSRRIGKVAKLCFFWVRHFDKIIPEPYNIDSASGVFFLGKKRMTPIDANQVIAHYKGAQK